MSKRLWMSTLELKSLRPDLQVSIQAMTAMLPLIITNEKRVQLITKQEVANPGGSRSIHTSGIRWFSFLTHFLPDSALISVFAAQRALLGFLPQFLSF